MRTDEVREESMRVTVPKEYRLRFNVKMIIEKQQIITNFGSLEVSSPSKAEQKENDIDYLTKVA